MLGFVDGLTVFWSAEGIWVVSLERLVVLDEKDLLKNAGLF